MEEQVQNQLETKPTDAVIARLADDADPRFRLRAILPTGYSVPTDGPMVRVLKRMGRHPVRPAHLHFMVRRHRQAETGADCQQNPKREEVVTPSRPA